jgi:hypothetical protein
METPPFFLLSVLVTFAAGCSTFESRVREKSQAFESLDQEDRTRLAKGKIAVGDTEDMVYIALGHPDDKRERTTVEGSEQVWIYKCHWQEYQGTAWTGWRRTVVPSANGRNYFIYHEPVSFEVYRNNVDEVIRVAFVQQKVVNVDQRLNR